MFNFDKSIKVMTFLNRQMIRLHFVKAIFSVKGDLYKNEFILKI